MTQALQIAGLVLLIFGIIVAWKLFEVLTQVKQTLVNLEQTRTEINGTLLRVEGVIDTTNKLMNEQIQPTIAIARLTLEHVEVTTSALADATLSIRRITGRAESFTTAGGLMTSGAAIAQTLLARRGSSSQKQERGKSRSAPAKASRVNPLLGLAIGAFQLLTKRNHTPETSHDKNGKEDRLLPVVTNNGK